VIINPKLEVVEAEPAVFYEGCLSVPGFVAQVPRALSVRVEALDHRGEPVRIEAKGWYARILQHEIDHLQGGLYIDRMDPRTFASTRERARR
jgi:peptide deformylase